MTWDLRSQNKGELIIVNKQISINILFPQLNDCNPTEFTKVRKYS